MFSLSLACLPLSYLVNFFFHNLLYHLTWVPSMLFEDMALESCEGGEPLDQITRVSK